MKMFYNPRACRDSLAKIARSTMKQYGPEGELQFRTLRIHLYTVSVDSPLHTKPFITNDELGPVVQS